MKKLILSAAIIALVGWIYFAPENANSFLFEYFPTLFWSLIIGVIALFGILFIYSVYAHNVSFKTKESIRTEPDGNGGGSVIIDIQNLSGGMLVVSSAGVYDRRLVFEKHGRGNRHYNKDVALYSKEQVGSKSLPLKIENNSSDSVIVSVSSRSFQGDFSGVFYDIDANASDIANKYAKKFADGNLQLGDAPQGIVRKKISDRRLKQIFKA